jgi:azurin
MGVIQLNIVIFKYESADKEIIKLSYIYFGGDAPDDNRILAKSIFIVKQEETTIEFDAPKKPGRYLYVCTYIAHAGSMRGYMIVE